MTDTGFNDRTFDDELMAGLVVPGLPADMEERILAKARGLGLVKDGPAGRRASKTSRWRLLALAAVLAAAAALAATVGRGVWSAREDRQEEPAAIGGRGASSEAAGHEDGARAASQTGPGAPGAGCQGLGVDGGVQDGAQAAAAGPGDIEPAVCTARVTVRVQGQTKPGLRVELIRDSFGGFGPSEVLVSGAGEDGVARFEGVTQGTWKANAVLEGYTQARAERLRCTEKRELLEDAVDLKRASVLVFGRITDRDGVPLANSSLEVRKQQSMSDFSTGLLASVDSQGHYRVWLPADGENYFAWAGAVGHEPKGQPVPAHESTVEIDFRLLRLSVIHGVVVGPDGPVPRADLMIQNHPDDHSVIIKSWRTDDQGRFSMEVGPSRADISAHKGDLSGSVSVPAPEEGRDCTGSSSS